VSFSMAIGWTARQESDLRMMLAHGSGTRRINEGTIMACKLQKRNERAYSSSPRRLFTRETPAHEYATFAIWRRTD
jgi:hypothetical protein